MSGNENVGDGVSDGTGNGGAGTAWGWEPVPHGGEYDSDATAFVKLPPDMLGATGTGEPLAAPGHGFVPPPMIVPLGSAATDPAATGTWTMPVRWPEAGGSAPAAPAARAQAAPAPVLGPIPAVIPMPASAMAAMAALHDADGDPARGGEDRGAADPGAGYEHAYGHAHGQDHGHDSASTAEWHFPEAAQGADAPYADGPYAADPYAGDPYAGGGQGAQTGQWAIPVIEGELPEESGEFRRGAMEADWSQAPATLPGGAAAPWAAQPGHGVFGAEPVTDPYAAPAVGPAAELEADAHAVAAAAGTAARDAAGGFDAFGTLDPEQTMSAGVLPAAGPAAPAPATGRRVLGGPGVGSAPRGPRVLGGPGVGTPLPEHLHHLDQPEHADHLAHEEGPVHPAAPDIDAAHGAAAAPLTAERPHPAADPAPDHAGFDHGAGLDHGQGLGHDGAGSDLGAGPGSAGAGGASGGAEGEHRETGADPGAGDPAEVPDPRATYDEGVAAPAPQAPRAPDAEPVGEAAGEPVAESAAEPVGAVGPVHEEHPLASYVLRVNGADRPVTGAWIGESLLYVLRERLGLAGAKDGCSQGECGACAVQVDGRLVASCLVPAATAASSEVRTVEGLATDGELSDVQQALCRSGAVQCGFCIPGMAMTIHDLLEGNHAPSELETRQALCGNLCRCSGYRGVIDAVGEVVAEREAAAEAAASAVAGGPAGGTAGGTAEGAEPRIPHQAAPGEGGIHPDHQHGGMA
ncbi:(2Fe-2S)-binding protein [Streptomyces sp. NPDC098789]|uniref:(2Fe-2S)-binding protein n=1 Tax=Streptomyces sp. NPDC098789 TaxID=3366098 RepID=UPI0038060422